jgi:hypothetical protein
VGQTVRDSGRRVRALRMPDDHPKVLEDESHFFGNTWKGSVCRRTALGRPRDELNLYLANVENRVSS